GGGYGEQAAREKEILVSLGFIWKYDEAVWNQQIIPGIRGYSEVFKNGNIPHEFVVPSEDPWPRSAWATNLVSKLTNIGHRILFGILRSRCGFAGCIGRQSETVKSTTSRTT
ncbi:hypothetical protein JG687_00017625, partial [Phytophthora cactorum]